MNELHPKFKPGSHLDYLTTKYMPTIQADLSESAKEYGKHKPYSSQPYIGKKLSTRKKAEDG